MTENPILETRVQVCARQARMCLERKMLENPKFCEFELSGTWEVPQKEWR